MDWSTRIVVQAVTAFVLLNSGVVLAILRLGGVINWPARWVVFVFVGILLVPIALLFLSVLGESERQEEPGFFAPLFSWILYSLPWGSRRER